MALASADLPEIFCNVTSSHAFPLDAIGRLTGKARDVVTGFLDGDKATHAASVNGTRVPVQ